MIIAKLIIKNYKYLIFVQLIKIKLNLNSIILRKKSYIAVIFLIIDYNTAFITWKKIIRKKLLLKKQYLAKKQEMPIILFYTSQKSF